MALVLFIIWVMQLFVMSIIHVVKIKNCVMQLVLCEVHWHRCNLRHKL